jgi:hypothetical protein
MNQPSNKESLSLAGAIERARQATAHVRSTQERVEQTLERSGRIASAEGGPKSSASKRRPRASSSAM